MTSSSEPIRPDELDGLFARFLAEAAAPRTALAVSGGSDSTALMILFADWLRQAGRAIGEHAVLTVDHRLRPESGNEAQGVAGAARALGFAARVLAWEGPKPDTGLQAAARQARYGLIAAHMRAHGMSLLFTAHTAEDQAETLLMRLARGSGLDGLSAMAPLAPLEAAGSGGGPLTIARPLLGVTKARLRATLEQRGAAWVEDPSNQSPAFERVRLRAAGPALAALGLTSEMLGLSARRLQRARAALERATEAFFEAAGNVHIDPCGFFRLDRARLCRAPLEIIVRALAEAVAEAGGSGDPVPLAGIEAIAEALCRDGAPGSWTLARAMLTATPKTVTVEREPGRAPLPELTLAPGAEALWDGRFRVAAAASLSGPLDVRALGLEGVREARRSLSVPAAAPAGALRALPGFWRGGSLLAVPTLGFWASEEARAGTTARFKALRPYNSAAGQNSATC